MQRAMEKVERVLHLYLWFTAAMFPFLHKVCYVSLFPCASDRACLIYPSMRDDRCRIIAGAKTEYVLH